MQESNIFIRISEKCTGCGACEAINSSVFSIKERAQVNEREIPNNMNDCIDAAIICPVNAILLVRN